MPSEFHPISVLVVEASTNKSLAVRVLLEEPGPVAGLTHEICWVTGFHDAVAHIRRRSFDLLLVAEDPARWTGLRLLREMRALGFQGEVLLLVDQADEALDLEAVQLGAADVLEVGALTGAGLTRAMRFAVARRRNAPEAQAAERELTRMVQAARCLFFECDVRHIEGQFIWRGTIRNPEAVQRLLDLDVPEWATVADAFDNAKHDEDRERVALTGETAIASGASGYRQEYRVRTRTGEIRWLYEDVRIEPNGEARWTITGVAVDITEQKRTEEFLRRAEEINRAIVRSALDCVISIDQGGHVIEFNPAAERTFGYTRAEAMGQLLSELIIPEENRPLHQRGLRHFMQSGVSRLMNQRLEMIALKKDGTPIRVELTINPVDIHGAPMVVGFLRDITDRYQTEQRLHRHEIAQRNLARRLEAERARLAEAQSIAQIGSWELSLRSGLFRASDEVFRIAGESPIDFDGGADAFREMIHPDDRETVLTAFHLAIAEHRNFEWEHRLVRRDGSVRIVHQRAELRYDANGVPIRCIGTTQDVTDIRQDQEALQGLQRQYELILRSVGEGILGLDTDGYVTFENLASQRMLGWEPHEIIGHRAHSAIHHSKPNGEELPLLESSCQITLRYGVEVRRDDEVFWRKDGTCFPVEYACTPILNDQGEVTAAVIVYRDITERKNAQMALQTANERLEQRVVERTAALELSNQQMLAAKLQADSANHAKSEFLSRMSHELRTPLNAIIGFGQLLDRLVTEPNAKECVEHILKGGRHLLSLINEILDLSQVESGRMHLHVEAVDVKSVVKDACTILRPLAQDREIALEFDARGWTDLVVRADAKRLSQVLLNLISNAIKYNRDHGTVRVDCRRTTHDRVRIEIRDTGMGIPQEKLPQLFQPFNRLGAERTAIEGTGLGLSLSLRLVTLMGGRLGVESTEGQGSTFSLELLPWGGEPLRPMPSE